MTKHEVLMTRRGLIKRTGEAALLLAASGLRSRSAHADASVSLPFENGERPLIAYPQKRPLIRLTTRPPQLETPFAVFDDGVFTPNDAFFVRYHLANAPPEIDPDTFRLTIKGKANTPLSLSLPDLENGFTPVEIAAVNQCSGNSQGLFNPRVAGGQLANGAMGNALWKGIPLKHILDKAGVQEGARQVTFNGLDGPAIDATPDFVKALDIDHARDGEVMVAYVMNGEDLPILNGYPLRLVVPGYYGTYWVKHLSEIEVTGTVFDGYWMKTAYRVPDNACACVPPGTAPASTVPIGRYNVRSFITNIADGAKVRAAVPTILKGIAFDGGYGISSVAVSGDGGKTWQDATLGQDLGKYSFRTWQTAIALKPGPHELKVRAINRIGQSQPSAPLWNPAGYMRNAVETVRVTAS
jgi:sulfite dehydrogenase (cytochrome) subunit A